MDLLNGEQIVWRGRSSWRSMIGFYLKWGILSLVPGVGAQLLKSLASVSLPVIWFWVATAVLLVLTLVCGWLARIDLLYTITNQRIHVREGILGRRDHTTTHARIQNVNTTQSMLQRMLKVGDVDFDTAGSDDYDFRFEGVGDPEKIVQMVAGLERDGPTPSAASGGV